MNLINNFRNFGINKDLLNGEKIVSKANITYYSQLISITYVLILAFIVFKIFHLFSIFFLALIFLIIPIIKVKSTSLYLTNKRIIARFGLTKQQKVDILLKKVESIEIEQSLIGRLLNYGSITINGTGGRNPAIPYVHNPNEFKEEIYALLQLNGDF